MYYDDVRLERELNFVQKIGALTEHDMHLHDALEVSILLENDAKYRLVDRDYYGKPGDVFVFRPFEPHYNLAQSTEKPVKWIMLLFSPSIVKFIPEGSKLLQPFYTAAGRFSPLIPAQSPFAGLIHAAAKQAVAEEEQKLPGWQAKQYLYFIDILVSIFRYYLEGFRDVSSLGRKPNEAMIRVIEFVLSHFTEEIEMDQLIVMSNMRKTMFFKQFKELTSLSPNEFISRLRLQSALYYLDHTDKSITEIAYECGFHSLSYFNKQFKQFRGIAPREHRAKLKVRNE